MNWQAVIVVFSVCAFLSTFVTLVCIGGSAQGRKAHEDEE